MAEVVENAVLSRAIILRWRPFAEYSQFLPITEKKFFKLGPPSGHLHLRSTNCSLAYFSLFFSSSLQTLCMRAHVRKSCAGLLPRACVCTWQRRGREVITSVESQHARSLKEEKRVRGE